MFTTERLLAEWHCNGIDTQDLAACAKRLNAIEKHLGSGWVDAYADQSFVDSGGQKNDQPQQIYAPKGRGLLTLRILSRLGELLLASEKVLRFSRIRDRLKSPADFSAGWSELFAASLFLSAGFHLEYSPTVRVDGRSIVPDFAVFANGKRILVEVFRPGSSDWQRQAAVVMQRILDPSGATNQLPRGFQLSIALRRLPSPFEELQLNIAVENSVKTARLGLFTPAHEIASSEPGEADSIAQIIVSDQVDQKWPSACSRFLRGRGLTLFVATPGSIPLLSPIALPAMWMAVGLSFKDKRGYLNLDKEIRQLPSDEPTLVIIDTSETPGIAIAWKQVIEQFLVDRQELDLTHRSKPSVVWCTGETVTPDGPVRMVPTAVYENSSAPLLPDDLSQYLRSQSWGQGVAG